MDAATIGERANGFVKAKYFSIEWHLVFNSQRPPTGPFVQHSCADVHERHSGILLSLILNLVAHGFAETVHEPRTPNTIEHRIEMRYLLQSQLPSGVDSPPKQPKPRIIVRHTVRRDGEVPSMQRAGKSATLVNAPFQADEHEQTVGFTAVRCTTNREISTPKTNVLAYRGNCDRSRKTISGSFYHSIDQSPTARASNPGTSLTPVYLSSGSRKMANPS
ncbi:hypothetical protein C8J56DRAFT_895210 [Mycena floridula]|nr:hypothetical protein C8J56DRAFT_895210 [Mycena floridula]